MRPGSRSKQGQKGSKRPAVASLSLLLAAVFGLFCILSTGGCSSSSDSTTTTTASEAEVTGYRLPTQVSAVPTAETTSAESVRTGTRLATALRALAGTDYSNAETNRFVEEPALEQFEIVEQVLGALEQTHFSDAANIGIGAYLCMVAWEEEENGKSIKQLERWIVQSDAILEDGQTILRVRLWIEERDEDPPYELGYAKGEMKVYASATKKADGSYADYGVWTMNVKFSDEGDDFFAASASVADDGKSIIKVHESFPEGMPGSPVELVAEMKAIMYRSDTEGYGKVLYPNFHALFGPGTDPSSATEIPHKEAYYAYNTAYLAVKDGESDTAYKDRDEANGVEMTHRYGVFNKDTGADVEKSMSFGFPIRYTDDNGVPRHAFYGAWQGRHEFWGQGGNATITEGTAVIREDQPPEEAETYTVGPTFNGTLTKRTYEDADLSDIRDIPVEIWINSDYNLIYADHDNDGGTDPVWTYCTEMDWGAYPPTCAATLEVFDDEIGFEALIVGENDDKKCLGINGWDQVEEKPIEYVYEAASADNGSQAGFYLAEQGQGCKATVVTPRQLLTPSEGDNLNVWMGGSIYVEYKGDSADDDYPTDWVEKEVVGFNTMTWMPEFSEAGDKDYTLPTGRELYINLQGANYVVTNDGGTITCKFELQDCANPNNATTVVPAGTVFKEQWNAENSSTYAFVTDSSSANYMLLVYETIGDNDKNQDGSNKEGVAADAVVTSDMWGLAAYSDNTATGVMYNWEYKAAGDNWGAMSYLMDGDTYKILDNPMRFDSITATNGADETKTLALQFDGWMMGLPMMYDELMKNNWVMSTDIANKVINLAAGTEVTSSDTVYLLKPLEISVFLAPVTTAEIEAAGGTVPTISLGEDIDLSGVPDFVEHGMGDPPTDPPLKYSEGNLIE